MMKWNLARAAIAAGMLVALSSAKATVVDLTNSDQGSITNQYGTAVFQFAPSQPTATGVIQPFLRVQSNPTEQGYNTSGTPQFDAKAGLGTRDIQFSDLQSTTVMLNGTSYFTILLDVDEPNGSKSNISLDSLQFYTSATGSKSTIDIASLGTLRYDLDAGGDNSVIFDAARTHGSGSGDAYIYIPTSAFEGTNSADYVYMYVAFGSGAASEGGFEEFALVRNTCVIPEMGALFPIVGLLVAVGSTHVLRRRRMAKAAL